MKRTLFNIGKQVVKAKPYSTAQLMNSLVIPNKLLDVFSNEARSMVSNEIQHAIYKVSFQELQKNLQKGNELITNRAKRDPLGSLAAFERAAKIADGILEAYPAESLNVENKFSLAQAYANYADILRICATGKVELREEMVKKALELDPKNEIARELNFNMHFYDIVPEPPSNKI